MLIWIKQNFKFYYPYLFFASAYFIWAIYTYDNIVHMDIIYITGHQLKNLLEHNFTWHDIFYKPYFPYFFSLLYTFFIAKFLHFNTYYEIVLAALILICFGLYFLKQIFINLNNSKEKLCYSAFMGLFLFGLHKWEGVLTSFGSLSFSIMLFIFVVSYKIVLTLSNDEGVNKWNKWYWYFLFGSFCCIIECSTYYMVFNFVITTFLLVLRYCKLQSLHKKNWQTLLLTNILLLLFVFVLDKTLPYDDFFKQAKEAYSLSDCWRQFLEKPIWFVKFYFIGFTGLYIGKPLNFMPDLRACLGIGIAAVYVLAIYYVIKTKNKKLYLPMAMLMFNFFQFFFVTISRYKFNVLDGAAASRYTAVGVSGVIGLFTIAFFYLKDTPKSLQTKLVQAIFIANIFCFLAVDFWQAFYKTPIRRQEHAVIKSCILNNVYHPYFQSDSALVMVAIKVLQDHHLNVCYDEK